MQPDIRILLVGAAAFMLQGAVRAQLPVVVPVVYVGQEGPGSSEAPGDWVPLHMQCLYEKAAVAGSGTVTGIRYRRDGSAATYAAHTQTVALAMSSIGVPEQEYSSSHYARNRGADHVQVFSGPVNYPPEGGVTMPPAPFTLSIPLSVPFSLAPNLNLLVEMVVSGTTFNSMGWRGDATAGIVLQPDGLVFSVSNTGCPPSFTDNVLGSRPWPGAPLILTSASGATGVVPGVSIIGAAFPATIDLTFLGAPSCGLVQNLNLQLPLVSDGAGTFRTDWGNLPRNAALRNRLLNLQTVAVDTSFNTLGLRVSEGLQLQIGAGFPVGLEAHSWYDRRDNTGGLGSLADFRSTRAPIIELY